MPNDNVKEFNANTKDFGLEPLTFEMSEPDKKLSALFLAINASLAQFVLEGILTPADQVHFVVHMQDFAAKLYTGEVIKIDGVNQTLNVNSLIGKIFLDEANDALLNGKENVSKMRKAIDELAKEQGADKQTNLDESASEKPKWLN